MGMIKLPQGSVNFFKENLDEIFNSGNLAEGKWNKEISMYINNHCNVSCSVPTTSNGSGLVALMMIYKTYFDRTNVLIQSNTMYGVKTMVYTSGCNLSVILIVHSKHLCLPSNRSEKRLNILKVIRKV